VPNTQASVSPSGLGLGGGNPLTATQQPSQGLFGGSFSALSSNSLGSQQQPQQQGGLFGAAGLPGLQGRPETNTAGGGMFGGAAVGGAPGGGLFGGGGGGGGGLFGAGGASAQGGGGGLFGVNGGAGGSLFGTSEMCCSFFLYACVICMFVCVFVYFSSRSQAQRHAHFEILFIYA